MTRGHGVFLVEAVSNRLARCNGALLGQLVLCAIIGLQLTLRQAQKSSGSMNYMTVERSDAPPTLSEHIVLRQDHDC